MKKADVSVGVIGLRNHAARLIDVLKASSKVSSVLAYHPTKTGPSTGFKITNNFDEIVNCDVVVIASPTNTHSEYIAKLAEFPGYIFVEKPAVASAEEEQCILGFGSDFKSRLYVNYNFVFSEIYQEIRRIIDSRILGKIVHVSIESCHGLAFRDSYRDSWRSSSKQGVGEVVAVHFVHMINRLFPGVNGDAASLFAANYSGNGTAPDSIYLTLQNKDQASFSILASYAMPYQFAIKIGGTDGVLSYDGAQLTVRSPRDTFDGEGRFSLPPIVDKKSISHAGSWQTGLARSVEFFLEHAVSGKRFEKQLLTDALAAMRPFY